MIILQLHFPLLAKLDIITDIAGVHRVADLNPDNKRKTKPYDSIIQGSKGIIITGPELMTLTLTQLKLCQYEELVFARTTPEQKQRIVQEFKSCGNVVTVTGDGVNNGPSLNAADCGMAMGAGSNVMKEILLSRHVPLYCTNPRLGLSSVIASTAMGMQLSTAHSVQCNGNSYYYYYYLPCL